MRHLNDFNHTPKRWIRRLLLSAAIAAIAQPLHAETHALILTIGNYAQPSAKLHGIDADARLARQIVQRLGATHIEQLADGQLNFFALRNAVQALQAKVRPGDSLIVYFSGHGKRRTRGGLAGQCQVGLVSVDGRYYLDELFEADLKALARVAARVVVFNDSCHAAGAVAQTKDLRSADDEFQIKAYPVDLDEPAMPKAGAGAAAADDDCARISNNAATKSFGTLGPEDRIVYLAAAAPDEAAWASPSGSLATLSWHRCLTNPSARYDRNRDGHISADELAQCANEVLPSFAQGRQQTVKALFNTAWPLQRLGGR